MCWNPSWGASGFWNKKGGGYNLLLMFENIVFVGFTAVSLMWGLYVFLRPAQVIELQRRFYLLINWKIEPVSMVKEIRNTKFMGQFLIFFVVFVCAFRVFLLRK